MALPLILIGGGGHCKSVIEAARSAGRKVAGILDVDDKVGSTVCGVPIIGTEDMLPSLVADHEFIVTVGFIKDPTVRIRIYRHILGCGGTPATVVASSANVSPHATVGRGSVVLHGACVNADAHVGDNVIINTLANVDHDVVVGDHCHVSTCASLNGMTEVGDATFVGSGSVVAQCVKICPAAILGAGTVVIKDIIEPGTYVGNPARRIL